MDTIELLTHFTLTRQEATIYILLCAEGDLTGYEVAKLTGVSRSNAYTALAGLVDKGAAYAIEGAPTRYTPVLLSDFCDNKIRQLQRFKQMLLAAQPDRREESDGYITVKGEKHILDKMKNMLSMAKERVYLSVSDKILAEVMPELTEAVARGLKVVLITNPPFELEGALVHHTEKEQHAIRFIADSKNVLTGDIMDGGNSTCLYSQKKNLIDLFKEALKNEIKLIELTKGDKV